MTYVLLILVWCLTSSLQLHACNSRPLSSIDHKANHSISAVLEKAKYQHSDETSNPSNLKPAAIMQSQQELEAIIINSGNGLTKSFSHAELLLSTETSNKGQKGQAIRSMLGVGFIPQATEETVNSKESDTTTADDIVMMDYAQPHRKPPIHNEKP